MNNASDAAPGASNAVESTQTNDRAGESFSREAREEPLAETIEETVGYAPPPPASHAGERTKAQVEAEAAAEEQEAEEQEAEEQEAEEQEAGD